MQGLVLVLLVVAVPIQVIHATRDLSRLAVHLTKDYVNFVDTGNTTVEMGISVTAIDYDVSNEVLISHLWERYSWSDERLVWDPNEYGGIQRISLPASMIWTPDIVLYNDQYDRNLGRQDINVVIDSRGVVHWIPPSVYKTSCPNEGPKDPGPYSCILKFGSWTHDGLSLDLKTSDHDNGVDTSQFAYSRKFNLTATGQRNVKIYEGLPEPYVDFTVYLRIQPRTG